MSMSDPKFTRAAASARGLSRLRRTLLLPGLLAAAMVLGPTSVFAPSEAEARGGAPARPVRDPALGQRMFDDCVRWVALNQSQGIQRVQDFYTKLDAQMNLDSARHRGAMRIWWKGNDKFRWELTGTSTKILNVNRQTNPPRSRMWLIQGGRVRRMHGTAEGAGAIKQLQEDSSRLGDLAQFITLRELKGPNVTFTFEGLTQGDGTYRGNWAKVVRRMPGAANITFWMAYMRDAQGQLRATYPGIVRVDGVPGRYPTEDYILRDWQKSPEGQPRGFRYPRTIEAYSFMPGTGQAPARFLRATVQDIKINAGIDETRFSPPSRVR